MFGQVSTWRDRNDLSDTFSAGIACGPTKESPMSKKDEYFTMMESEIKKWDAEVDKLRAKSDQLSAEARAKYDEQIKAMRASRDAANRKLQEIRAASESAWQHMQA